MEKAPERRRAWIHGVPRALEALEDRVENRRPELGAPLQGARRPDPGVAGGERVL